MVAPTTERLAAKTAKTAIVPSAKGNGVPPSTKGMAEAVNNVVIAAGPVAAKKRDSGPPCGNLEISARVGK